MRCFQMGILHLQALAVVLATFASAQADEPAAYDHRQSVEYRALDVAVRTKLNQVVQDFAAIEAAIIKFMAAHQGQPPQSLDELVPRFLAALPQDPFANSKAELPGNWQRSLDGKGYLYQQRPGPVFVSSWETPIKWQQLDGAWQIKSAGLMNFPLRYASKNGRGLLRTKGYWGRMKLDVF